MAATKIGLPYTSSARTENTETINNALLKQIGTTFGKSLAKTFWLKVVARK